MRGMFRCLFYDYQDLIIQTLSSVIGTFSYKNDSGVSSNYVTFQMSINKKIKKILLSLSSKSGIKKGLKNSPKRNSVKPPYTRTSNENIDD